jgi:hypothetical protein
MVLEDPGPPAGEQSSVWHRFVKIRELEQAVAHLLVVIEVELLAHDREEVTRPAASR